jgi:hypothetical protein
VFTWAAGDSQEERFEAARAFYVDALAPKRKRPGKTIESFRAALARLPMHVLRLFAAGLRRTLLLKLGPWLNDSGFIPIGCDGSRLACPCTQELERRLGSSGKKGGAKKGGAKKGGAKKGGAKKGGAKKGGAKKGGAKKGGAKKGGAKKGGAKKGGAKKGGAKKGGAKKGGAKKGGAKKGGAKKGGAKKGGAKKGGAKKGGAKKGGAKKGGAKKNGVPQLWLTAMVHLTTGLPWSWRLGKADASERDHLERLLPTLPEGALLVTDAGYYGADLARSILKSGGDFLMRVGSKSTLYTELQPAEGWRDGMVMLWTQRDQQAKKPPLFLRLIRLHEPKRKVDVWLLTNVMSRRLSVQQASRFYRLRWENEGFFRTYKKTLKQVKLAGRTVRQVHREAEGAMLAAQLLLAQGVCARAALLSKDVRCSPRGALLEVRREIRECHKRRGRKSYWQRLGKAGREDRPNRKKGKVKRRWDTRHDHKPPKPPDLRTMSDELIAKLHKILGVT